MNMPLIKARTHRVRIIWHICRLQEPNRDVLVLYARFIGDTVDYVLNQLIETTIVKDREFVAWRAEHPDTIGATPVRPTAPPPNVAPTSGPDPTSVEVSARPQIGSVGRGGRDDGAGRP
jgi:hypothetical protein